MLIELAQRMHSLSDAEMLGCTIILGIASKRGAILFLGVLVLWQLETIASLLGGLK
jgi:hypothetical protein